MEYSSNAKMMLGYIDDDDDEILDYDGQLDLSEDNEEEDEAESVQEYNQHYPETPEEKINWQEQIRMIHLRSHLNQLLEKVKDAQYVTDKAREELKKCRGQIKQFEGERDRLFNDIRNKESDGNQSAVYRVRAAHERVCAELDAEQKLEKMLIERLDKAEYDLAISEVERGKFILAEDDLLHREHQLSKEKTDMAMVRLHKEEMLARQAMIKKNKDDKTRLDVKKDMERRHKKALDEAERSHERANKYLNKTLEKLKTREHEEEERYKNSMDKKMDMLLKLKADITHNRDNLKAIRARDKAGENKLKKEEMGERQKIIANGGNPEEILLVKKRQNEFAQNKQQFDAVQKEKKSDIMQKILLEEENMKRRKQRQPYLWDSPSNEKKSRVAPHKQKPLKALDDYIHDNKADEMMEIDGIEDNREREILPVQKKKKKPKTSIKKESVTRDSPRESEEVERKQSKDGERKQSQDGEQRSSEDCQPKEGDEDQELIPKESFESFHSNNYDYRRMLRKLSAEMQGIPYESMTKLSVEIDSVDGKKGKKKVPDKTVDKAKNKNSNMMSTEAVDADAAVANNDNEETSGVEFEGDDDEAENKDDCEDENVDENREGYEEDEGILDKVEEERAQLQDEETDDLFLHHKDVSDSSSDENEEEQIDLAKPEFEGLWNVETKPYRIPKEIDPALLKPVGGSKMDKEIMKKTLEKTREGIVIQQMAAGREFTGCPFYSKPDVIHFKDFVVGKSYKKKVLLTNVSYTVNYIKFMDITERLKDFIKIHFDPPGQMSAGLTCEMIVTFKPMINEDLKGEVNFLTQTGPFQIPLVCSTKKCDLCLDTGSVDFGTAVIGETLKRTFTLTNRGALGTKFDFFKVTGMKNRTLTTAVTSLGRMDSSSTILFAAAVTKPPPEVEVEIAMESEKPSDNQIVTAEPAQVPVTGDSSRGVSPDSAEVGEKPKQAGSNSQITVVHKRKSEEELEKIPEAGEVSVPPEGDGPPVPDESEMTEGANTVEQPTTDISDQKQDRDFEEAISPDLAVSEMDDYSSLDGMRVGPLVTGEIGPFSSLRLEIVWQPSIPGKVDSEFLVSFADPLSESLSIHALASAIDVPVWVERQTVDLKICMFDRLYQDTIIVNNRATTALRLKFEVCKELSNHLELLPKTGYIQAQSQFSAQLKFLPRPSLFMEASKYFDPETGVLEAPMTIRVADQTTPVVFTVQAVVTNSEMEFDITDIDFGYCTIHESVKKTIKLTNKSILSQQYGFVGLPDYVEVQPNDGFGTLLPLETLELDVIFSPKKTKEYKLDLVCRSLINKDFKISCKGIGVLTPLELTHQVIHFAATPLYDIASTSFHVVNSHTSSNEFTHPVPRIGTGDIAPVGPTSFEFKIPPNAPFSISPCVGTVKPGKKAQIQVRFTPTLNDEDVRQEALRIHNKMEAVREEREREEAALREKQEKEQNAAAAGKGGKAKASPKGAAPKGSKLSGVPSATSSAVTMTTSPRFDQEALTRDSPEYLAAVTSLVRQFKGQFRSFTVPCYVASGATRNPGELSYSIHNTLYLEVHCPAVKPPIVVISDGGRRTVDFGDVSIGQTYPKSVTIQNISNENVELRATALHPHGPFVMLNALRVLDPGGTHTILLTFSPEQGQMFQEEFGIKTLNSTLHLTFRGRGVSPLVNLSVEDNLFDCSSVLVGEYVEKNFKIQNTSPLAIDYVIKQDSLSQLRHKKAQGLPPFLNRNEVANFVGVQNDSGKNVFDIVPTKGSIQAGETKEIMVTFAPDHESDLYSDGVRIELFDQRIKVAILPVKQKEESHFFRLLGQAKPRVMFLDGADPLLPSIESLALHHVHIEEDDPGDGKGTVVSPPALVTIRSVMKDDTFQPGVREIYAGCVRTMAVSQKKPGKTNGEFSLDGIQGLIQKGFTVEPQKGMVEAGTKKPIVFTWTPPQGYDPSCSIEETATLTLRCDVTEQITLMIRAMVVTE